MQVVEVAFSLVVVLCVGLVERTVANGKYNILLSGSFYYLLIHVRVHLT